MIPRAVLYSVGGYYVCEALHSWRWQAEHRLAQYSGSDEAGMTGSA